MKKILSFVLVIMIVLVGIVSTASASSVSNINVTATSDGNVRVTWDGSLASGSMFKVRYRLDEWASGFNYYSETKSNSITLYYLVPGQTYTISVDNGGLLNTSTSYTVPYTIFREYTINNYLRLTETEFSISRLEDNPTATFEVRVFWPKLKNDREYAAKLALKTPLGFSGATNAWDSFTFENRYQYTRITYSMMTDWLKNVEDEFGEIPTGKYQFQFYVDGQLYDVADFRVTR